MKKIQIPVRQKTAFRLIVAVSLALHSGCFRDAKKSMITNNDIRISVPFTFSEVLDPRKVLTVGDQFLAEHVYAFHSKSDFRTGFSSVFSDFQIAKSNSTQEYEVTLTLLHRVIDSDGVEVGLLDICESLVNSLRSARHISIADGFKCKIADRRIVLNLPVNPVNLKHLLTLPDLAIVKTTQSATGPYFLKKREGQKFLLGRNHHYPAQLVANTMEQIEVNAYSASESKNVSQDLTKECVDLAYFYGYAVSRQDLDQVRSQGYRVSQFPSEWLLYIGVNKNIRQKIKGKVHEAAQNIRKKFLENIEGAVTAYSISPADRSFGLKKDVSLTQASQLSLPKVDQEIRIATLESWAELPAFQIAIAELKSQFSKVKLVIFKRSEISKMWSLDGVDMIISPLGISAADPISHLSFLCDVIPGFSDVVSKKELERASETLEADSFAKLIQSYEKKIADSGVIVSLAHFPGVVVESVRLEKDLNLAWSWGIQAWTYKIKN